MEDGAEELEDLVHFSVSELPSRGYGVMEEIRRQGKLCDVTLKVPQAAGRREPGPAREDRGAGPLGEARSGERRGGERGLEGDRVGQRGRRVGRRTCAALRPEKERLSGAPPGPSEWEASGGPPPLSVADRSPGTGRPSLEEGVGAVPPLCPAPPKHLPGLQGHPLVPPKFAGWWRRGLRRRGHRLPLVVPLPPCLLRT